MTRCRALLLGLGCAVWAGWWTRDLVPARYVIPAFTLLGLVLLARWPVRAGFGLVALLAAYPLMDVHVDNGSFLMPTLVASYLMGRTAPVWPGLAVVGGFDGVLTIDDPTVPNAILRALSAGRHVAAREADPAADRSRSPRRSRAGAAGGRGPGRDRHPGDF